MKTLPYKIAFILLLNIQAICLKAQNNTAKNTEYFELRASALLNDKKTSDYEISIHLDGKLMEAVTVKRNKPVNIILESNRVYSIVFKKENYPTRIVIVNTEIPKGIKDLSAEEFEMQIELSPDFSTHKKEMEDYPVAVLHINKKERLLMASEDYYNVTHHNNDLQALAK